MLLAVFAKMIIMIKVLQVLVLLPLVLARPGGPEPSLRVQSGAIASSDCDPESVCLNEDRAMEVCGSDNETYASRCHLRVAAHCSHGLKPMHHGPCRHQDSKTSCEEERASALHASSSPSFVPVCRQDGSFAEVQCQYDTGFCWCVTNNGRPVPGSAVQYAKPNCVGAGTGARQRRGRRRRPKRRRRPQRRRACTQSDRVEFNNHVLDFITDEFKKSGENKDNVKNDKDNDNDKSAEDGVKERRREEVRWKFDQMDTDKDGLLRRREFRPFRETIRRVARRGVCGRNFWAYCDMDGDKRLTIREWNTCLGIDLNISFRLFMSLSAADEPDETGRSGQRRRMRDQRRNRQGNSGSRLTSQWHGPLAMTRDENVKNEEEDEENASKTNNCWIKRNSALTSSTEKGAYVPECEQNGQFKRIQCYQKSGYCWCVDGPSGRPIVGTSVRDSTPNCDVIHQGSNVRARSEAWKKCGEPRKSRFRSNLKKFMADAMRSNRFVGASNTKELRIARWHFNKLDKNDDGELSRRELRPFRQQLLENRRLKLCGKRFQLQCDKDGDRKITLNEWNQCVGVVEESISSLPGPPTMRVGGDRSHKRRGPNPLDTYLSAD